MYNIDGHLKITMAAALIAFASTLNAVHIHPLTSSASECEYSVASERDAHDCVYCWVIYQTLTVAPASCTSRATADEQEYPALCRPAITSARTTYFGRAPPFFA